MFVHFTAGISPVRANMLKHVHPIVTGMSSVTSRMCQIVLLRCGNRRVSCARARVYSSVLHPGEHQKLPVRACPNLNTSFPEGFGVAMPRISAVIALCPFGIRGVTYSIERFLGLNLERLNHLC